MSDPKKSRIPTSRLNRFGRFARLTGRLAGAMAAEAVRQLAQGNRPRLQQLVLTPANARRLASELSKMRGAAMKLGQILSMDTGDHVPKELAEILARLRDKAHFMPAKQLLKQLTDNYGEDWQQRFTDFDHNPIAAASIGQVHKARLDNGQELALKIQYPGIRDSINSDVENLASLLKVTGLVPSSMDTAPLLKAIKKQLHDEADYVLEAKYLTAFGKLLTDDPRFSVPRWFKPYSTDSILAMSFLEADPIETLADKTQDEIDSAMGALFELMLQELLDLRMMQTDPNFANYRYDANTGTIILLDFGATCKFTAKFSADYLRLIKAIISNDDTGILKAAQAIGYQSEHASDGYKALLITIFRGIGEIFNSEEPYDFKNSDLIERLANINDDMMNFKQDWQAPPVNAIYFHRKLGGMFMLANRINAKVAMRPLLEKYL